MLKNKVVLGLVSAAGVFVLAIAGLFAYLSYQIHDIKTPLLNFLKSQIAGDLQIGEADVVFFPPGINLKDTKLYAPGETEPSATIGKAELRFNLIPLVRKKFEGRLMLDQPDILLHRSKDGKTNMEKIFAPLLSGEAKEKSNPLDQLWWKRIAIDKLKIRDAHFRATQDGRPEISELKNLGIEADHIRFDQVDRPAHLKIQYTMPQISDQPMQLETGLVFDEASQGLNFKDGKFSWGKASMDFGGKALLPSPQRKYVALDLAFGSDKVDLKDLSKMMKQPLPASGILKIRGSVTGTAFAPLIKAVLDSPALIVSGKNLSNFHAELSKQEKPIKIENSSFGIYGGSVGVSGEALPGPTTSANVNVVLKSISLAAASGKSGNPARLSGNLKLSSPNVSNPSSFGGGGTIAVGPFPLPVMNLQSKVKVAEILAAGTGAGQMINVGMLSSSANVIGTQIDVVKASVRINGNNITLAPFTMGNSHFTASGNANIAQEKTINGGGTFNLNPGVTAQLITDPMLRSAVTGGRGGLSVPFSISGPLDDPNISVDSGYIKGLVAKATAVGLKNMLMGGIKPGNMLNAALKNTPLGNPQNPLSQILGGPPQQTTAQTNPTTRNQATTQRQTTQQFQTQTLTPQQKRNQAIQRLLFGQ